MSSQWPSVSSCVMLAELVPSRVRARTRHRRGSVACAGVVNAGRAFVVIGAAELFWIVTEWPNGAQAITFAAIAVILLAPRADQAYAAAKGFMVGTAIGVRTWEAKPFNLKK